MANLEGKTWGRTRVVEANPFCSFHRAEVKAGFRCSRHRHDTKFNGFLVESGVLAVRVYRENGIEDVTELRAGDYTAVPAGLDHRFECIEDAVLFELYWPALRHDDIVRKDIGGPLEPTRPQDP